MSITTKIKTESIVVLPTYNEKGNLRRIAEEILAQCDDVSILVVDDASPDGTGRLANALTDRYPDRVFVLHRKGQRGRGLAGVDGFRWACKQDVEFVLEMDADLSHPPKFIPMLVETAKEVDLAIGSRYIKGGKVIGWGPRRHLQSRVANFLTRNILGIRVKDATSGYRCFRRECLNSIIWDDYLSEGPSIVEEILVKFFDKGYSSKEIPITFIERQVGESKVSIPLIVRWIKTLWKVRKRRNK